MLDQATELRKLVLRSMRQHPAATAPPPRLLALAGGQQGVGVTTIALNLAIAFCQQGSRVVIVDANPRNADVAARCGLRHPVTPVANTQSGQDIHELLQRGPSGLQILAGLEWQTDSGQVEVERLLRQLKTLGRHADIVVLDCGLAANASVVGFAQAADETLLVTTTDDSAVMETYASLKSSLRDVEAAVLSLVVNQVRRPEEAQGVHQRIEHSCQRFLDRSLRMAGYVLHDQHVTRTSAQGIPLILGEPHSPATRTLQQLAARLASSRGESAGRTSGLAA